MSSYVVPTPWKLLKVWGVGGLFQVGYAEDSDLLLVLSSDGLGVFDCLTGEKIARDLSCAHDYFDSIKLTAKGFGPLAEQTIRMAGLYGGGLPLFTKDGWGLELKANRWSHHDIYLRFPWQRDIPYQQQPEPTLIGNDEPCELRAFGFSETGKSFIIASSCEVQIFTRQSS